MDSLLHIAHYGFLVLHTTLTLFNMLGWIWRSTRRWNLALLLLTGGSWFILGMFYGIGYCPFTDWHWQVLYELGQYPGTNSYMVYLIRELTGVGLSRAVVDTGTVAGYFLALALSAVLNFRDRSRRRA